MKEMYPKRSENEESDNESHSDFSSFEEDTDLIINNALKHNVELMNRHEEIIQYNTNKVLIYDYNAKMLR